MNMQIHYNEIKEAKHIVLVADSEALSNASAIYSYILTLHKKVSLCTTGEINRKFAFLPWFDGLRTTLPSSCDLTITVDSDTKSLLQFFKDNGIKINQKMATALYSGMLIQYKSLVSEECDGMTFALMSELIELKADYKLCNRFIRKSVPLCAMRLKAILLKNMLLRENGTAVDVYLYDEYLKDTGASTEDAYMIMHEILNLVNVNKVTLYDKDDTILKIIEEI